MKLSGGLIFVKMNFEKKRVKMKNWNNHEKAEQKKTSENLGKKKTGKGGNARMAD